ncbi:peptide/nickel transport system permease protein [Actinopolymorpha cephalotaxi]|uniref:Peptide/nickel transport system permease protein n=1 Tax=Actinopolymorpha cephalotaxi TaxID=504797 RepID=A0A1I3CAS1_9ACTN|nr:ABC transporter permease [Actinopolymorpha cephalotaxi]NYH86731.1 peptide/nickel transport system permease protein [Actinopolymorpha cephalotaxi]SFH71632.1 peptide/nickel transport system permease protein [Actinopolymorpha cephalotaxi]
MPETLAVTSNTADGVNEQDAASGGRSTTTSGAWQRLLTAKFVTGTTMVLLIVMFGIVAPFFSQNPRKIDNVGLTPPGGGHLLGTTQIGQDVFAQLAYSTRGSLIVGVAVAALILALSALFGILGAYIGGTTDEGFSLLSNVMLVIPGLPLVIVIASYVQQKSVLLVILVLGLTGWAASARVLRAQTLSLRNRDYVLASRVAGERSWRVICVEILPNLLPVMSSGFVFGIVGAILAEAGLSFIGIGASGSLTWGTMLAGASDGQALLFGAWWWFAPPGLMIALLGTGLSLINFSIDEVINPKLRTYRVRAIRRGGPHRKGSVEPA